MKLYVMYRLLGNGGFDLFFFFANSAEPDFIGQTVC